MVWWDSRSRRRVRGRRIRAPIRRPRPGPREDVDVLVSERRTRRRLPMLPVQIFRLVPVLVHWVHDLVGGWRRSPLGWRRSTSLAPGIGSRRDSSGIGGWVVGAGYYRTTSFSRTTVRNWSRPRPSHPTVRRSPRHRIIARILSSIIGRRGCSVGAWRGRSRRKIWTTSRRPVGRRTWHSPSPVEWRPSLYRPAWPAWPGTPHDHGIIPRC